jgi:hypothetical protein
MALGFRRVVGEPDPTHELDVPSSTPGGRDAQISE